MEKINITEGLKIYGNIESIYKQQLSTFINYTLPTNLQSLVYYYEEKNYECCKNTLINIKGGSRSYL